MKNIVSLHNNKSNQLNNNIIFYLTASKSNDYEGLKKWLASADHSIHSSAIEYILLLDSIGESNTLNLDYFYPSQERFENDPFIKSFRDITKEYNINLKENQSRE